MVIIEDMRPYNMRINDNVIHTIKFIGETEWRLKQLGIEYRLFPRWMIKSWVFNTFREMSLQEIQKKIAYAIVRDIKLLPEGSKIRKRTATFAYVDDRIVEKGMKTWWGIKKPKVGHPTPFGLKTHSWQGLAVATFYVVSEDPSFRPIPAID